MKSEIEALGRLADAASELVVNIAQLKDAEDGTCYAPPECMFWANKAICLSKNMGCNRVTFPH